MSDRLQPQNIEAEKAVLGAMLSSKEAVPKAFEKLKATDFYQDSHGTIFRAMLTLFNDNKPIDTLTVTNRLKQDRRIESVGGAFYITGLVDATPTAANIEAHANVVLQKSLSRQLLLLSMTMTNDAYDDVKDLTELLDAAHRGIFNISQGHIKGGFVDVETVVHKTLKEFDYQSTQGGISGISTGLVDLDNITAGFHKGELTVIAGRPSMGKTSLALTIAKNMSSKQGIGVGIFSLEMDCVEIVKRLMLAESRVDGQKMRIGKLKKEDWTKLMDTGGIIAELPIHIDQSLVNSITELSAKARRLKTEHNVGVIIIDYIQLLSAGGKTESKNQEVAQITRALKGLAKELNIVIIALSQLSRNVEYRKPPIPQLSDLRESGAIEQDADLVIFLYRKYHYTGEDKGDAMVIIAKQRNGETGTIHLSFIENYAKFEDRARDLT